MQRKKETNYDYGRIHIVEDVQEKLATARLLGNRYNPNDEESLRHEMEKGFSRMMMLCLNIEQLTDKEAKELVKEHN